jgi:sialic acid synthase SpsE
MALLEPKLEILDETDLECRSPADGLPPSMLHSLIGKSLAHSIEKYAPIDLSDLI